MSGTPESDKVAGVASQKLPGRSALGTSAVNPYQSPAITQLTSGGQAASQSQIQIVALQTAAFLSIVAWGCLLATVNVGLFDPIPQPLGSFIYKATGHIGGLACILTVPALTLVIWRANLWRRVIAIIIALAMSPIYFVLLYGLFNYR